jgi:YidC/Oxa1 family membrane protein insertase
MMETQRLILYVALGLVLMLLWQSWVEYTMPRTPVTQTTQGPAESQTPGAPDASVPTAPEAPDTPSATALEPSPEDSSAGIESSRSVVVETDTIRAEISTIGADIRKIELLKYSVDVGDLDRSLSLMNADGADIFISETGLLGRGHEFPNHRTEWSIDADRFVLDASANSIEVVFSWQPTDQLSYRKVYRFHRDSYLVDIEYQVDNQGETAWNGFQYAQFVRTDVSDEGSFGFIGTLPSYKGGAIYTPEERFQKIDFGDMQSQDLARRTETGWVSMLQHYFVGAWLPTDPGPYEFYTSVANPGASPLYRIGYKTLEPVSITPGSSGVLHNQLFIGPKDQERLDQAAEGLVLTVDYGWLTAIAAPLFWVLNWIHNVVGNWGWAIIFLTVLIKLVFFPLSAASYRSMAKMKNLQPRLKTLKERYGDDKQKFQQEMMKIYKEEKINPLGGCLPILIQIPVFIALYWVLLESVELRQAQWFWLKDLSVRDPYFILPILMGASMVIQQRLNPAPMDEIQKKVMMALPVVFTVFFLFFPSGLVLYWVVNNVLSIGQQWFITNKLQSKS